METATTSGMVRINLNALHAVRKSFIKAKSREKIRRALRSNIKTYADEVFVTSDTVYHRRQNWSDMAEHLLDASMSLNEGKQRIGKFKEWRK